MDLKEFKYCQDVYNECVIGGTLIPSKLKKAYWYITGREKDEPIVPVRKAKLTIFNFFQHQAAQVLYDLQRLIDKPTPDTDETDSNLPLTSDTISVDNTNQSHDEQNLFDATQGLTENKDDGFELYQEKEKLEADYLLADTSNLKRSITMKLKAINKKLEDKLNG